MTETPVKQRQGNKRGELRRQAAQRGYRTTDGGVLNMIRALLREEGNRNRVAARLGVTKHSLDQFVQIRGYRFVRHRLLKVKVEQQAQTEIRD